VVAIPIDTSVAVVRRRRRIRRPANLRCQYRKPVDGFCSSLTARIRSTRGHKRRDLYMVPGPRRQLHVVFDQCSDTSLFEKTNIAAHLQIVSHMTVCPCARSKECTLNSIVYHLKYGSRNLTQLWIPGSSCILADGRVGIGCSQFKL